MRAIKHATSFQTQRGSVLFLIPSLSRHSSSLYAPFSRCPPLYHVSSLLFPFLPSALLDAFQIRFLADPNGSFSRALDLSFDGSAIFGGPRSKRFALVVDNGVVVKAHVEPDNTGLKGM